MHKFFAKIRGKSDGSHSDGEGSSSEKSDSDVDTLNEDLDEMRLDPTSTSLDVFEKKVILGNLPIPSPLPHYASVLLRPFFLILCLSPSTNFAI